MITHKQDGFSMVGLVIAIAVIGLLTAALLPKTLKSRFVDIQLAEQARLKAMGDALRSFVVDRHQVPGAAALVNANANVPAWNAAIAQYANESPQQIVVSGMNQQVIYFYPDNFLGAAGATLPYDQFDYYTQTGSFLTNAPNARVMIVSNLGQTPLATASGALAAADFDAVWNQAGIPPALAELTESDTLKIERVNLNPSFFSVSLANNSANPGSFAVDGNPGVSPYAQVPANAAQDLWLIKGSRLSLFDANGALQTVYAVTDVAQFVYDGAQWNGGGLAGGGAGAGGGGAGAGAGGGGQIGSIFNSQQQGQLTQWGSNPNCVSQGLTTLTVINNTADTYWAYTGNGAGNAGQLLGKIKKNRTVTFNIDGCALYAIVPEVKNANTPAYIYIDYMNNAPVTVTIP